MADEEEPTEEDPSNADDPASGGPKEPQEDSIIEIQGTNEVPSQGSPVGHGSIHKTGSVKSKSQPISNGGPTKSSRDLVITEKTGSGTPEMSHRTSGADKQEKAAELAMKEKDPYSERTIVDQSGLKEKPRPKLQRPCQKRLYDMIGKRELKNEELGKREDDLRQRLDVLECSMPAVMVWNIWRMAQGATVPCPKMAMETQFQGPAGGEICCPSTPSRHFDPRVREAEAERKQAQRRAEEARMTCKEKLESLEEKKLKLEEAKRIQEERQRRIEALTKELKELRGAMGKMEIDGVCETGECGDIQCKQRWLSKVTSTSSIKSSDVECLEKLQELAEMELAMKKQISDLERREEAYMRTLQQADKLWAKADGDAATTLSALQEQLNLKTAANQQLADRICELEDDLEKLRTRMAKCRNELEKYMTVEQIQAAVGRDDDVADVTDKAALAKIKVEHKVVGDEDDFATVDEKEVLIKEELVDEEVLVSIKEEVEDEATLADIKEEVEDEATLADIKEEVEDEATLADIKEEVEDEATLADIKEEVADEATLADIKEVVVDKAMLANIKEVVVDKAMLTDIKEEVKDKETLAEIKEEVKDEETFVSIKEDVEDKETSALIQEVLEDKETMAPISEYVEDKQTMAPISEYVEDKQTMAPISEYVQDKETLATTKDDLVDKGTLTVRRDVAEEDAGLPSKDDVIAQQKVASEKDTAQVEETLKPTKEDLTVEKALPTAKDFVAVEVTLLPTEDKSRVQETVKPAKDSADDEIAEKSVRKDTESEGVPAPAKGGAVEAGVAEPAKGKVEEKMATEAEVVDAEALVSAKDAAEKDAEGTEIVKPPEDEVLRKEYLKTPEPEEAARMAPTVDDKTISVQPVAAGPRDMTTREQLEHEELIKSDERLREAAKYLAQLKSLDELEEDGVVCPPDFPCNDEDFAETGMDDDEPAALERRELSTIIEEKGQEEVEERVVEDLVSQPEEVQERERKVESEIPGIPEIQLGKDDIVVRRSELQSWLESLNTFRKATRRCPGCCSIGKELSSLAEKIAGLLGVEVEEISDADEGTEAEDTSTEAPNLTFEDEVVRELEVKPKETILEDPKEVAENVANEFDAEEVSKVPVEAADGEKVDDRQVVSEITEKPGIPMAREDERGAAGVEEEEVCVEEEEVCVGEEKVCGVIEKPAELTDKPGRLIDLSAVAKPYLAVADIEQAEKELPEPTLGKDVPCPCKPIGSPGEPARGTRTRMEVTQTAVQSETIEIITQTASNAGTQTFPAQRIIKRLQGSKVDTMTRVIQEEPVLPFQKADWRRHLRDPMAPSRTNESQTGKSGLPRSKPRYPARHIPDIPQSSRTEDSSRFDAEQELRSINYGRKSDDVSEVGCSCCRCGKKPGPLHLMKSPIAEQGPTGSKAFPKTRTPKDLRAHQEQGRLCPDCRTRRLGDKKETKPKMATKKSTCDQEACTCTSIKPEPAPNKVRSKKKAPEMKDQGCIARIPRSKSTACGRKKDPMVDGQRTLKTKDEAENNEGMENCCCYEMIETGAGPKKKLICSCGESD